MRKFAIVTLMLITILGCSKDPVDQTPENEDYYDCTDFFLTGDYSTFCTINTSIVNISDSTIDGGGTICKYIIPALNDETEVASGVQFTSLETSDQALHSFNSRRLQSETFAKDDSLRFHEEIMIDGLEGYVAEGKYANFSKSVSVRYKNVLVTTAVIYYKDWYPVTPCNYETNELIDLMSNVLKNM